MNKGKDRHVGIQYMHAECPKCDETEKLRVLFCELEKKIEEWQEESTDNQSRIEHVPGFNVSLDEPFRFLRNVAVPDQHILAESDVTPKNDKREEQLAHYMVMLLVHELQVPGIFKAENNKNN